DLAGKSPSLDYGNRSPSTRPTRRQPATGYGRGLPIAGKRHNHVLIAVFGPAYGRLVGAADGERETFLVVEHFEKIDHEPRIEHDLDFFMVISDRQLDLGFTDIARPGRQHQPPVAEAEVDAAAFIAGGDG